MKVDIEFRVDDGWRESVCDGVKMTTWGANMNEHIANLVIALENIIDLDLCDVAFEIVASGELNIDKIEKLRNDIDEIVMRHKGNLAQFEKSVIEENAC